MSFISNYKQLNAAQKQAVDSIDGPVLVVAGPGTGKTQLLALRAANILQKTDTAPQNILCLTYTEVGARNMRERLANLVGQAAYDIRISTYHGFGSDLIRSNGEYFSEYGAEQPVDRLGQDTILQEIFAKLPATNPLWRGDTYLKDTLSFIGEAKNALLQPNDIRDIANKNQKFIATASTFTKEVLGNVVRIDKSVISAFLKLLIELSTMTSQETLAGTIQPLANLAVSQLGEALTSVEATGKTNELTKFKNTWLIKDTNNEWIFTGAREIAKLNGAADVYEQYDAALKEAKLFDYSDMITRVIEGLETHNDLRYSLHEQYQYIMLDEFQDTNLAQLRLVNLLTNNPSNEGRPNILAVGDDDQAIYSFQGAELTNMLRFTQMYKSVEVINLTENYRSHADILLTAQNVASQIEERLHNSFGTEEKVLTAGNSSLPAKATIARQQFKSDIAQFDWVANQIQSLIKEGTAPTQIAVLAPQHRHLEPLVAYLQALEIPIRYDKRENVLDDHHIKELIRMAELVMALAANDQSLADSIWPSVLSADFWALATSAIWQLSWQSNENRYKADKPSHWQALMMENELLKPIGLFFAKLAAVTQAETLESMFDYLVGVTPLTLNEDGLIEYSSPYYNYYFSGKARATSPQAFTHILSNLTVLRQHLREYRRTADEPLQLQDLLTFVADYRAAGEKLLNTSPYYSAQEAVQLMTAYGAKGLEFGAVFILATQDDVWGMSARGRHNNITLPQNLQIIRRAGSSKDEKKRLFYVALTRAKHSLFITSYSQNYAGKATTSLEFLNETDGKSLGLPVANQNIITSDADAPARESLQHFWQTRHAPEGVKRPSLRDLVLPRLEDFQLSATHLNAFTDLVYAGPDAFFINTVLRFPKAPTADGQYGNAIHETLEAMQHALRREGELPDVEEAIAIFTEKLKAKRLSDNDFSRQQSRGAQALAEFLPQWWHNFTPDAESEKDFKHEGAFVADAHLSGKLDQLLVDNVSKRIRLVDFKTGKSHSRWTQDVKMHKYRQQLLFYKLLVEASHSYKNYEVEQGSLVFVEPDEARKVNTLSLKYTSDDLERTRKLINAVWHRIKKLDLPDVSDYSADLKGIVAFENWLIDSDL